MAEALLRLTRWRVSAANRGPKCSTLAHRLMAESIPAPPAVSTFRKLRKAEYIITTAESPQAMS